MWKIRIRWILIRSGNPDPKDDSIYLDIFHRIDICNCWKQTFCRLSPSVNEKRAFCKRWGYEGLQPLLLFFHTHSHQQTLPFAQTPKSERGSLETMKYYNPS